MQKIKITLSSNNNDFTHNTKFMFEYLLKNEAYDIKYIINNDETRNKLISIYGDKFISIKEKNGLDFLKKSNVWLLDAGMPVKNPFYMRNKTIINFWHGVPIKKIGINGYTGLNKLRMLLQLKVFSFFVTAYITTSKNLVNIMSESFLLPVNKIKILGQPRNDFIYKIIPKKDMSNIFKNIDINSRFVLYAPTWRKSKYGTSLKNTVKYFPFEGFSFEDFNSFLKKNNIVFFVRPHSLEKINIKEYSNIKILDQTKIQNINDILNIFDLVISDYSGIWVDFLLLKKPIILLPYDLNEYLSIKGLNFNFDDINPGPKIQTLQEFKNNIIRLLNDNTYFFDRREKINDFFNEIKFDSMPKILNFLETELKKYEKNNFCN